MACVVSGGNVDVNFVAQIIQRGMLKNGRYREVTAAIGDKSGYAAPLSGHHRQRKGQRH